MKKYTFPQFRTALRAYYCLPASMILALDLWTQWKAGNHTHPALQFISKLP